MTNNVIYSRCNSYNQELIDQSVDFIFENSPGLVEKISNAKKILIKPNLLSAKTPDKAITTNPLLIKSIINKINKDNKEIIIADSPGGPMNEASLDKVYQLCGIQNVAETTGSKLNYDSTEVAIDNKLAVIAKNIKVLQLAEDVDLIINVAKLKTHCFTMLTCATKNLYGLIPGLIKVKYHFNMPKIEVFSNMLIDLALYYQDKSFHFIDGIEGMEGFGPSNGSKINANCILAGDNSFYLDILAAKVMGIDPLKVYTITESANRNLVSSASYEAINIVQDSEPLTFNFKLPPDRQSSLPGFLPKWITSIIQESLIPKPIVNVNKCVGCKKCEESCPPQTIKVTNRIAKVENYATCIKCYCCQELCPHDAIELSKPIGRRIIKLFKKR